MKFEFYLYLTNKIYSLFKPNFAIINLKKNYIPKTLL